MRNYHTWLLDLDDTLQIGPLSWAVMHLFPALIKQTGVKPDQATFEAAYGRAEDLYNAGGNNDVLGDEFFQLMGWSRDLKAGVVERFTSEYQPGLFEDTLPFLKWAAGRGDRMVVIANNKWARPICQQLGIADYFLEILSPVEYGLPEKPSPAMWEYLQARTDSGDPAGTVMVGNTMNTDGYFARNCGLDCIIVDRYDRYGQMPERCEKVTSLADIVALMSQAK